MLRATRSPWLLLVLLALAALSTAFSVEDALNIDGINAYFYHGVKRQAQGTSSSSSATAPPSSSSQNVVPSSSAPSPTSASSVSPSDPPSSSRNPVSPVPSASTTQPPASSRTSARTSVTERPLLSTQVEPVTVVVTVISDGQTLQQTSVGSRTQIYTTGTITESTLPTADSDGGSSGGLSSTNKSIIGGVIGGVGGAILLGGIAVVCWRMWGRKKRVTEDDADLMAGTGSALGDKSHAGSSPFQSNLEQYHNPGGRPNAAANF